jgi:hypothetical protein
MLGLPLFNRTTSPILIGFPPIVRLDQLLAMLAVLLFLPRTTKLCGPLTRRKTHTPGGLSRVAGLQKLLVRT